MLDLEIYTDKIAESGRRLIRKAFDEAQNRNHNQMAPEHIFLSIAVIEERVFNEVMQSLKVDSKEILEAIENYSKEYKSTKRQTALRMSEAFRILLADALKNAHANHRRATELEDLFIALFQNEENYIVKLFQQFGVDRKMAIQEIQKHSGNLNRG